MIKRPIIIIISLSMFIIFGDVFRQIPNNLTWCLFTGLTLIPLFLFYPIKLSCAKWKDIELISYAYENNLINKQTSTIWLITKDGLEDLRKLVQEHLNHTTN